MFLSIILIPFLSALVCGFGRRIGFTGAKIVSTTLISITCLISCVSFYNVGLLKNPYYIVLGSWINSDLFYVNWSFLFDSLSVTMLVVVTSVSALVHLYSTSYMSEDPHVGRFMSYLSLFTFFMIILVTADNFLQLFLGWEGVGLCSYLLINFWFTRIQANKAAIKALVINKLGDYTLFIAILLIHFTFKTIDFSTVFLLVPFFTGKKIFIFFSYFDTINVICLLLFIGAVGKSAQIGLHTWLPDAMEGPTPVSALIHAATMVTAGIFLIIRCSPIFEYSPVILNLITIIGATTAFFAATIGLVQNDIKKIIAYSTCSQLGYMTFVCGLSNYSTGLFHLSNHAFFKALLFLSAGSIIHSLNNEQDIRKMGGLLNIMPFTYAMFLIGSLSLAGFPFLSGFYSKDIILELAYTKYSLSSTFAYWLGTTTAIFTAVYSIRLLWYVFYTETNTYKKIVTYSHESSFSMLLPLGVLSFGSIFSGYLSKDLFIGLGSDFYIDAIYTLPKNSIITSSEFEVPLFYKLAPTCLSILGMLLSIFSLCFYQKYLTDLRFWKKIESINLVEYASYFNNFVELPISFKEWFLNIRFYKFFINKWYFDYLYNELIAKQLLIISYDVCFKLLDKGFVELVGPKGFTSIFYRLALILRNQQTGFIYQYICLMLVGFLLMFVYLI